jgi:hypothetical protein
VLLAMMRLVYDNDHPAKDLKDFPRWNPEDGSGWSSDEDHGFRNAGAAGETQWLRYFHRLRGNRLKRQLVNDFMGYNTESRSFQPNWASDLILECEVTVERPEGELTLELSRGVDRFQARWDLTSGDCTLVRLSDGREQKIKTERTAIKKKGTYRLRFADVDEKLTVWVDNALPFGEDGVVFEPPVKLGPSVANDLEPASIGVRGATVSVRKLKLFRDTYYTAGDSPTKADVSLNDRDWIVTDEQIKERHEPEAWSRLRGELRNDEIPVKTLFVQPGHYLCLGDNSTHSSDGRSWGLVPERLLLGRALMVYYPFPPFGQPRAGFIR